MLPKKTNMEKRYRKEIKEAIKKLNNVTMARVCRRVGVESANVLNGECKLETLEKVFDEYVYSTLKEIILIQADISYQRKLFYGGKNVGDNSGDSQYDNK